MRRQLALCFVLCAAASCWREIVLLGDQLGPGGTGGSASSTGGGGKGNYDQPDVSVAGGAGGSGNGSPNDAGMEMGADGSDAEDGADVEISETSIVEASNESEGSDNVVDASIDVMPEAGAVDDTPDAPLDVPIADSGSADSSTDSPASFGDFTDPTRWEVVSSMSATGFYAGPFEGGAFDGRYVYFVPTENYVDTNTKLIRYDTSGQYALAASWSQFDLATVSPQARGFSGAAFDGRYLYLAPFSGPAIALRCDTRAPAGCMSTSSWSAFDLTPLSTNGAGAEFKGVVYDGRYLTFSPFSVGILARFDTLAEGGFTASVLTRSLSDPRSPCS